MGEKIGGTSEENANAIEAHRNAFMLTSSKTRITLCGSTKFKKAYEYFNRYFSLNGHCVYSVSLFGHADSVPLTQDQKLMLDEVHKRKIDNSDEIFVLNVEGYIGNSTRSEIHYAFGSGKKVRYLSQEFPDWTEEKADFVSAFAKIAESYSLAASDIVLDPIERDKPITVSDHEGNWYTIPKRLHKYFQAVLSENNQDKVLIDFGEYMEKASEKRIEKLIELFDDTAIVVSNPFGASFIDSLNTWVEFALKTFANATPESWMLKLEEEKEEVMKELSSCKASNADLAIELSDCIICLIGVAAKSNITPYQLLESIVKKIEINMGRKWDDSEVRGVYKHIKDQQV